MIEYEDVPPRPGRVVGLFTAQTAGAPMCEHRWVEVVTGVGIRDDRYATRRGLYSTRHHEDRHLTIMEAETLVALRRDHDLDLPARLTRRNVVVEGIGLNALVGGWVRLGEVVVHVGRLNRPCHYLEKVTGLEVFDALVNRSGINCRVDQGGVLNVGDDVVPVVARHTPAAAERQS